jgi:DNA-binding NtrC family response regulator
LARLQAHDWPGNIRELRNVLERARLFADDGVLRAEHLPAGLGLGLRLSAVRAASGEPARAGAVAAAVPAPRVPLGAAELKQVAESTSLTRRELARQLGLSERTLYRRLKDLGLA